MKLMLLLTSLFLFGVAFTQQNINDVAQKKQTTINLGLDTKNIVADSVPPSVYTPPKGYVVLPMIDGTGERSNGYINRDYGAGILLTMLSGVDYNSLANLTKEGFDSNEEVYVMETKEFKTETGLSGVHFKVLFSEQKNTFIRYLIYVGNESQTLWLNITYPVIMNDEVEADILRSLTSINLKTDRK